jgi:hypothetical protein
MEPTKKQKKNPPAQPRQVKTKWWIRCIGEVILALAILMLFKVTPFYQGIDQVQRSLPASKQSPTVIQSMGTAATPLPLTGGNAPSVDELEKKILDMGMEVAGDAVSRVKVITYIHYDAYQALIALLERTLAGHKLRNVLHLDTVNGKLMEIIQPNDPISTYLPSEYYKNADQVKQALLAAWNDDYPDDPASSLENIIIPDGVEQTCGPTNAGTPAGLSILKKNGSIDLHSNGVKQQKQFPILVPRYGLQGKDCIMVEIDQHGLQLGAWEASQIGFIQPIDGGLHFASLSYYGTNGKNGPEKLYIPLTDFSQSGGPLDPLEPVGYMNISISSDQPFDMEILQVIAFRSIQH